jgi:glucan phosphoethanolaminetransferase (alkaline phosphatase superfamily)
MKLSPAWELAIWVAGMLLAMELFDNSHTFFVVPVTYVYGLALLSVAAALLWLKFRRKPVPRPRFLGIVSSICLAVVVGVFALYLWGVVTWYE